VATQNPDLRQKFAGKPEHVINFMRFIAQDMREIMAQLGVRTLDELIGRTDLLETSEAITHWKLQGIDLTPVLYRPHRPENVGHLQADGTKRPQQHGLEQTLDYQQLLAYCEPALARGELVHGEFPIRNVNRTVGTMVGNVLTRRYGRNGLPDDTISLKFFGSAGQSFGAFVPRGMTLRLEGDANDYLGKGLSGGKIVVIPPREATFRPEENIIIGNVAFYGATDGEAYIRGVAGERFGVRNSGVTAVVEGVGDHGCEYMTGGRVVVLGKTGRNFAAGMSGGFAYVLDEDGTFPQRCNLEMVDLEQVIQEDDMQLLERLIWNHAQLTNSDLAWSILMRWGETLPRFVKVMPRDYKQVLDTMETLRTEQHLDGDELAIEAFRLSQQALAVR
jgi:glutamate synthase (ferredoxin)